VIASVPQFVAHLNVPAKGAPARGSSGAQKPAQNTDKSSAPGQQARTAPAQSRPAAEVEATPLGSFPVKSSPTTESLPSQTEAFSRVWATALAETETATAQRLRSTKGLVLPLSEQKKAPQGPNNDSVVAGGFEGAFSNEKSDALPLVLSLNAPQSLPSAGSTGNGGTRGDVAPASQTGNDDVEDAPLSAAGEVAFTAKIKSPVSEAGAAVPVSTPNSALASVVSRDATSSQLADEGTNAATPLARGGLDEAPASGYAANAASPQPMREIALQLPGARGVEVRLSEHAGEVRIDVRSGDAGLTQDLRGNLHDLVSGLERKGFSAEVSHLPEHAAAPSRAADTGASKDQTPGGGQGGAFDRQPQQRNRQPGQQPEPTNSKARATAWNEQANSSFGKENQ
jgi:hypothetical protein